MAFGRSQAARRGAGKEEGAAADGEDGEVVIGPEEVLSWWFPDRDITVDRETFGRRMGWWFAGGPEVIERSKSASDTCSNRPARASSTTGPRHRGEGWRSSSCWTSSPATLTEACPSPTPRMHRPCGSPWRASRPGWTGG